MFTTLELEWNMCDHHDHVGYVALSTSTEGDESLTRSLRDIIYVHIAGHASRLIAS